jgi:hypothetical protein
VVDERAVADLGVVDLGVVADEDEVPNVRILYGGVVGKAGLVAHGYGIVVGAHGDVVLDVGLVAQLDPVPRGGAHDAVARDEVSLPDQDVPEDLRQGTDETGAVDHLGLASSM